MTHVATVSINDGQVAADLTDYVALITPDNAIDWDTFWATVTSGGGDIRCFKSDGTTELPREVVACDTVAETGEIHVKFSGTLLAVNGADRDIQIHADGVSSDYAVGATYGRNAVWSDYKAVYHGDNLIDSAGNYNLTAVSGAATGNSSGKIGDCFGPLVHTDPDYFENTSLTLDEPLTLQGWFNSETDTGNGQTWIQVVHRSSGDYARLAWQDNKPNNPVRSHANDIGGGSNETDTAAGSVSTGSWYMAHATFDTSGGTSVFFNGGSKSTESTNSLSLNTFDEISVGARTTGATQPFDGLLDEIRVAASGLSDGWITTEYNNQSAPNTFYGVTDAAGGGGVTLTVQDAAHAHLADGPFGLTQANTLVAADATHTHLAEGPVALSQAHTLTAGDATHSHLADGPLSLSQAHNLAVQEATHAHLAEGLLALVQSHALTAQDATHAHLVEGLVSLVQAHTLAVQEATHAHLVEGGLTLAAGISLVIADAQHNHLAESIVLVQAHTVSPADVTHAHLADNVTLQQGNTLGVEDLLHGHIADGGLSLVQSSSILVNDATHTHLVEVVELAQGSQVAVSDLLHSHAVEGNLGLSSSNLLAILDVLHTHSADGVNLTEASTLVVGGALHAHLADTVSLRLPGAVRAIEAHTLKVLADDRVLVINGDDRVLVMLNRGV